MGVNFTQDVIFGIKVLEDDCKQIISPAVYEKQNRYNPITGAVSSTVNVQVKSEVSKYTFLGQEFEDFFDIQNIFNDQEDIQCVFNREESSFYFGYEIGTKQDFGKVDLLYGEISLSELTDMEAKLKKIFPNLEIKLYLITDVG